VLVYLVLTASATIQLSQSPRQRVVLDEGFGSDSFTAAFSAPSDVLLKSRINGFAFQGEHGEDAFVYPPERFLTDESLQAFDSQRKLAERQ
jgi:hypothetical protein